MTPIEREIKHASESRWFLTHVLPYHGTANRLDGVVVTFVDITRRKAAEDALHQTAQRLRALVEASAQMVWTTDAQGGIVEESPSWREFTGQSYEQSKGWGWLDAVHPDDRGIAQRCVAGSRRGPARPWSASSAFITRKATPTAGRPSAPFRSSTNNGQIDGWVGMNIDISELRAADDALRDADKRKDEFLAVLGHELRNPLAPLSTGIQLLRSCNRQARD